MNDLLLNPEGPLVAYIQADAMAEPLIRHVSAMAEARGLPWLAVHVDDGRGVAADRLQAAIHATERLGGHYVQLHGKDTAALLRAFAHARRVGGFWLAGGAAKGLFDRCRNRLARELLRRCPGFEIAVLNLSMPPSATRRQADGGYASPAEYGIAVLAALLASLLALAVSQWLDLPDVSLVFMAAVLLTAVRGGLGPALLCALVSFMAYGLYFLPPSWSVVIQREEDVLTLMFLLFMAVLTGDLASRQKRQFVSLQAAQAETHELLAFSGRLMSARSPADLLMAFSEQMSDDALQICLIERDEQAHWRRLAGIEPDMSALERITADGVWQRQRPGGYESHTLGRPHWWWWPLLSDSGTLALLGVRNGSGDAIAEPRRRLIAMLAQSLSLALARVRLAEALADSHLARETERIRGALLASVSHDLRTPLTALRGAIETLALLDDSLDRQTRSELLHDLVGETARLDSRIQNLLDMARLRGRFDPERDWVVPGDLMAAAVRRVAPLSKHVGIAVSAPGGLPMLHVQAALIEQALVNVLENAVRFSPEGGRVAFEAGVDGETLQFTITDCGPGIPQHEQSAIFDMFYTAARGAHGDQGSGLGLAICAGMVEAHGGRVDVDSAPGRGTTLRICLPLQAQPALDEAPENGNGSDRAGKP